MGAGSRASSLARAGPISYLSSVAKILVVDDEEELRELLEESLRQAGHQVTCAANGHMAIVALSDPSADFQLVITDMYMPERDGLEVVMHCKKKKLPVIAMSGGGNDRVAGYDALPTAELLGAVTTVHKPFSLDYLSAIVETVLKRQ